MRWAGLRPTYKGSPLIFRAENIKGPYRIHIFYYGLLFSKTYFTVGQPKKQNICSKLNILEWCRIYMVHISIFLY